MVGQTLSRKIEAGSIFEIFYIRRMTLDTYTIRLRFWGWRKLILYSAFDVSRILRERRSLDSSLGVTLLSSMADLNFVSGVLNLSLCGY